MRAASPAAARLPVALAIHFERQSSLMCGLHAVNAMMQHEFGDHYTQRDLDAVCVMLDPPRCCHFNQHRNWSGLGDYDVNVLLFALASRGLDAEWHDARVPTSRMDLNSVVGLLVNGSGGGGSLSGGSGNHWYTVRCIGGEFWDLNSLHSRPRRFFDTGEMLNDMSRVLADGGAVIRIKRLSASNGSASGANGGGGPAVEVEPPTSLTARRPAAAAVEPPTSLTSKRRPATAAPAADMAAAKATVAATLAAEEAARAEAALRKAFAAAVPRVAAAPLASPALRPQQGRGSSLTSPVAPPARPPPLAGRPPPMRPPPRY